MSDVNAVLRDVTVAGKLAQRVDPRDGSVLFAAAQHALLFSLPSFVSQHAALRAQQVRAKKKKAAAAGGTGAPLVSVARLARRMWGDWKYNVRTRTFVSDNAVKAALIAAEEEAALGGPGHAQGDS